MSQTTSRNKIKSRQVNTDTIYVWKNYIINGAFDIAQRGASFTSATTPANSDDTYLLDRWIILSDGNDIANISQSTTKPDGFNYSQFAQVETANKKFGFLQIIESKNSVPLTNKYVSLSFYAKTTTAKVINKLRAGIISWSSTADTVTSDIISAWGNQGVTPTLVANWTFENTPADISISTTWTQYKIENVLIDTASMTNVGVFIWVDDTDAAVDDELYITGVMLNEGSVALPFKLAGEDYEGELRKCMRYYEASWEYGKTATDYLDQGRIGFYYPGVVTVANNSRQFVNFKVTKRTNAVPTLYPASATRTAGKCSDAGGNLKTVSVAIAGSKGFEAQYADDSIDGWWFHYRMDAEL